MPVLEETAVSTTEEATASTTLPPRPRVSRASRR